MIHLLFSFLGMTDSSSDYSNERDDTDEEISISIIMKQMK